MKENRSKSAFIIFQKARSFKVSLNKQRHASIDRDYIDFVSQKRVKFYIKNHVRFWPSTKIADKKTDTDGDEKIISKDPVSRKCC